MSAPPPRSRATSLPAHPSAEELNRVELNAILADPDRKQGFVTPMFEHIAPRYDAFTRLFSFGMDAGWKRTLVSWIPGASRGAPVRAVLDVACGTGDLAFAVAARLPNAQVTGVDAANGMIALARQRASRGIGLQVDFQAADLTATGLADASVDVITAGYAFRNVPALRPALREMARILRPGGMLLSLDFYRPENRIWKAVFLGYLRAAGSAVGWWWHRSPVLYAYIADSIAQHASLAEFRTALGDAGFDVTREASKLGGGIGLHAAQRRDGG